MTPPDLPRPPVRDLTDAEYEATYADGEPHHLPAEVLEELPGDRADVHEPRR